MSQLYIFTVFVCAVKKGKEAQLAAVQFKAVLNTATQ